MPELGKYAIEVTSAYAVSILLLVGLVVLSLRRGRSVARALKNAEERHKNG
ncbi:MAG: heme exporter protein CcmD [Alphaproteobacteria bacterium]|nr:heme exporter protein CcmD [Alphaproteobacteria bacterium]NNF25210.1 heme exporter protein CcmD [Paracoccaceae bacterium]